MSTPKAPTQAEALLELLRERGTQGVTPLLALDRIGSFRLGARIYDLRAAGHAISKTMVKTSGGAHVACYVLEVRRDYAQEALPW